MKHITYPETLAALEAAVELKGEDFVYQMRSKGGVLEAGCWYTWDGQPDCGVGHALITLGVPYEVIDHEVTDEELNHISVMWRYLADEGFQFDDASKRLLGAFQIRQDGGYTWGKSLREAIFHTEGELTCGSSSSSWQTAGQKPITTAF